MDPLAALSKTLRRDGTFDKFAAMEILQRHGGVRFVPGSSDEQQQRLQQLDAAASSIIRLFSRDSTLREVLDVVIKHDLFKVHDTLRSAMVEEDALAEQANRDVSAPEEADDRWRAVLDCHWSEFVSHREYLADRLPYGTHQGVKGSEYPRVQVILDDSEAGGFLFSYDKLFGAKELSKTDLENIEEGKETAIDRTLRLLYVTCSRPQDSLSIVYWSEDPKAAAASIRQGDWFEKHEVVLIEELDRAVT